MKNAVIAVISLLCGFLMLHALGAFDFGPVIDREHRGHYERARGKAVNASPEYVIGAVYNDQDWADVEAMRGVALALEMVNAKKPRKPLRLDARGTAHNKLLNNALVQEFADAPETAVLIGPFESVHIPSSRALSQFHGLPLVSPVAVVSEKLPALEPDSFVTVFPPLHLWVEAVLEHMEGRGVNNLLILGPQTGTYGDIFCTELERRSRGRQGFDQVFRVNYQEPFRRRDMERFLRAHVGKHGFQALFFGGGSADFLEFSSLAEEKGVSLPVYGSDDLYSPEIATAARAFALFVPNAVRGGDATAFDKMWQERNGAAPGYHARFGAETVFMLADLLQQEGGYHPQALVDSLRQALGNRHNDPEADVRIVMEVLPAR